MSHLFGDLVSQHLHRKHGLSQSKLAAGILQPPTVITAMCKGKRLTGPQARERVLAIIGWLHRQGALDTRDEANALLDAAGMSALTERQPAEAALMRRLLVSDTPVKSSESSPHRHNLPAPTTSLIGRDEDIATARKLLYRDDVRLITLLGPPGVGKTRLAIEVAREASGDNAFADGVWFVSLAPITDSDLVVTAITQTLGVTLAVDLPPIESLKRFLRDRRLLLLLDNFEHVLAAAPSIAEMLAAAPQIKALVTSRAVLHLSGEHEFEVQPLTTPPAVELFVQRAQAIKPNFAVSDHNAASVAEMCRRLDGLPLAIELAAAQIKLFNPKVLLARLSHRLDALTDGARDLPPRQRMLRHTIDWSYALLSLDEQRLFRRLGVFVGGWTLEAAEVIADSPSLLSALRSLINKSLVKQEGAADGEGETRFTMLETLREYALDCLGEHCEADITRRRHAEYFVELAECVQPNMSSIEMKARYARLDAEQDNCRAALGWALATGHAELGLRLAGALGEYWYWWASGWHEGWSWISQLLALPEAVQAKRARANALKAAVNLLQHLGDPAGANRLADESLALLRELGDKMGMAWVLAEKGCYAWDRADYAEAVTLCDESVALFREVGDQRGLAWALLWRAGVARDRGQFEEAGVLFEDSVTAAQAIGDQAIAGNVYRLLGELAFDTGDCERADAVQRRAIALCHEGGDMDGANYTLTCLARIALAKGDLDGAASQFEASESWFRQARQLNGLTDVLYHLGYIRHLQGKAREANALLREAMTLQWQQQLRRKLIQSLERCAWIAADIHQPQRAARLFGAIEAARERIGARLPLGDKPLYDRHLAQARADLDETAFDAAWAEGQAMTLDEAVEYALAEH